MNELCRFYSQHLPLYAEGELNDEYLRERIESHTLYCSDCQEWLEDYARFTVDILASEPASDRAATGHVDAIMDAVHGVDRGRRRLRRGRAVGMATGVAAAVVALASLATTFWPSRADSPDFELARRSVTDDLRVLAGPSSEEAVRALSENLWVLVEDRAAPPRPATSRREARLFGVFDRSGLVSTDPRDGWLVDVRMNEDFRDPEAGGWIFLVPLEDQARAIPVRRSRLRPFSTRDVLAERSGDPDGRLFRFVLVRDPRPADHVLPVIDLDPTPSFQDSLRPSRVMDQLEIVR